LQSACLLHDAAAAGGVVSCMIWERGEAHKVELTVVDVGLKIVERVDRLMSDQPTTYFVYGVVFSLALMLLPLVYRMYHTKDQLESLNYEALEDLHTAAQLAFGHNWRSAAFSELRQLTAGLSCSTHVLLVSCSCYIFWIFQCHKCQLLEKMPQGVTILAESTA